MIKTAVLGLAALGMALGPGVVPASASSSGFDFAQCGASPNGYSVAQTQSSGCGAAGYSNSAPFTQTIGSGSSAITVTATAYVTTSDSSATGTALESGNNAVIGQYTGNGIGICSIGDPGYSTSAPTSGCTAPSHQIDDSGDYEFILLTFSAPVNISSISLANFGGLSSQTQTQQLDALGFTYWANPSSESQIVAGGTTVLCGSGGAAACPTEEGTGGGIGSTDGANGSWITGFGANGQATLNSVTSLLIAADLNESDDFFKLQGIQASKTATPEPATFGLVGLSLVGLGIYRRGRKSNS